MSFKSELIKQRIDVYGRIQEARLKIKKHEKLITKLNNLIDILTIRKDGINDMVNDNKGIKKEWKKIKKNEKKIL